ncbi:MAG: hypothetical protein IJ719_19470 [Clostridia bacterium]|nr:hypothetical protein [Clostridia bacterium]
MTESRIYDCDLESVLTETRLTPYAEYKPFRAREAYLLMRRLGRPLTESEMSQFEYTEESRVDRVEAV